LSSRKREHLYAALNIAMRETSGTGVLYSQTAAARLGIAPTDLECLDWIARGPVTAGALAQVTGLTTGAITGVIDRLERAGFARRTPDPDDRRKVNVSAILPAIEKEVAPLYRPMEQTAMAALSKYSEKELQLILDFLDRSRESAAAALAALQAMPRGKPSKKQG
jgi:DNA-binding MarR family transcriptional regulator